MLTQIEELKSFVSQTTTSSEKGPDSMTCERNTQIHAMKAYAA